MTARGSGAASHTMAARRGASLPFRALWFLFVGWWLGAIWLALSWFLLVSVVGAPVGTKLLDGLPKVVSLKERPLLARRQPSGPGRRETPPLSARAVYFLLVGWWLSALWAAIAHAFTLTVLGIPIGTWMYARLPFVVSLAPR